MPQSPQPTALDATRTDPIRIEQQTLDAAWQRRADLLADLDATLGTTRGDDDTARARLARLRGRRAELQHAEAGLVFGRIDGDDGTVRHLGRVGLPGGDGDEPLVVDWRAPAARPFYTATPLDPQGLRRRRHIRTRGPQVLGVDDEPLGDTPGGTGDDAGLVGEGALLAALDERRTGRMGTAVATLQREQDDVVRADAGTPLVVQGGPGTGKTVVALHRVAYLLFSTPHLAERGVLVLGPSARFLDYIAQVLPALGETSVVSATCDTLVPGVRPTRPEAREAAEIKGRALWLPALTRYVDSLVPDGDALTLTFEGEEYTLTGPDVAAALHAARSGARSYHQARVVVVERLQDLLTDAVATRQTELLARAEEGFEDVLGRVDASLAKADDRAAPTGASGSDVDGTFSTDELATLHARIAAEPGVATALEHWWPHRDPADELAALLGDAERLRAHVPELTVTEADVVAAGAPSSGGRAGSAEGRWASSDVPLLDALAELLGDTAAPAEQGEFLADRAATRRDWVYGHVVVDEAQELSPMQWHMVVRRCPTRSVTSVGDIDQAESAHRHTDWADAVGDALGERWRRADLTICYRTPREVMELTAPVLRAAGSRNDPPRAVRSSGVEPWSRQVSADALPAVVREAVVGLRERYDGGTVGVVAPAGRVTALAACLADASPDLPDVPVLTAADAKGLEWDATVVVDPDGIAAGPRGWNALYVALTRCTQELGQIAVV